MKPNHPEELHAVIEISSHYGHVTYERDVSTGAILVDHFLTTNMVYPCNYGYLQNTFSEFQSPLDILVVTPTPVNRGAIVRCRPIGLLVMETEKGNQSKILGVPVSQLTPLYDHVHQFYDLPQLLLDQIVHFFSYYQEGEEGKVKIDGWLEKESALQWLQEKETAVKTAVS